MPKEEMLEYILEAITEASESTLEQIYWYLLENDYECCR